MTSLEYKVLRIAITYDWITATADSKINNKIWIIIKNIIIYDAILDPVLLNNVINKWPAIIFAVNRTAKVPGRIMFLIVSIKTIKGIKIAGVPWGIMWENMCW